MKKLLLILFSSLTLIIVHAQQTKEELDARDKKIIAELITPAQQQARENSQTVNWEELRKTITEKYSTTAADRAITKAKIYGSYGRDWPVFTVAIVHYTELYEDKEDPQLMNKNAQFVLQHSSSSEELGKALTWIKHVSEKEPANETYRQTLEAIQNKLKTQ